MQENFLRRKDAALYLRERFGFGAASTLAKLAVFGNGPVFCRRGRIPLYRAADLDTWANSQLTGPLRSTSDAAGLRDRPAKPCETAVST
jgi:hypothetical protein